MASPAQTNQIIKVIKLIASVIVAPVVSVKVMRTVAHLAFEFGFGFHRTAYRFPVICF
jgi:hypothetical protein